MRQKKSKSLNTIENHIDCIVKRINGLKAMINPKKITLRQKKKNFI